jgi:hypothetical protein
MNTQRALMRWGKTVYIDMVVVRVNLSRHGEENVKRVSKQTKNAEAQRLRGPALQSKYYTVYIRIVVRAKWRSGGYV